MIYMQITHGALALVKNITVNSKLRTTFNLKDKRIQEMRDDKIVNATYVLGIENPADLLINVQPAYKHNLLLKFISKIRIKTNPNPNPNTNTNPNT